MAGEANLSKGEGLLRYLPTVYMLHVGAIFIIYLEVDLMELVYKVLLGRPCACLSHDMASIGCDGGIVGVGRRWSIQRCVD